MKTLIPTLLLLACLSVACNKSDYADVQSGDQFRQVTSDRSLASIKGSAIGINAFTVNSSVFTVSTIGQTYGLQSQTWFRSEQGATLICTTRFPFPAGDGSYAFFFNNDIKKSNYMKVSVVMVDRSVAYDLQHAVEGVATLQVANGRFSLIIPEIQLDARDGSGGSIRVSGTLSSVSSSQGPIVDGPISNPPNNSGSNTDSNPNL